LLTIALMFAPKNYPQHSYAILHHTCGFSCEAGLYAFTALPGI